MNIEIIKPKIEQALNEKGFELYSIRRINSKSQPTLEIVVDRIEPINLDDIVNISRFLSDYLDEIDNESEPYTLDVSSLGAEKPIKTENLKKYVGSYVSLHLVNPVKGLNSYEGRINSYNDEKNEIELIFKEKTRKIKVIIAVDNIDKANLAIEF